MTDRFNFRIFDEQNNKFIYFSFERLVQAGYDYCRLSEMSDSGELLNNVQQSTGLKDKNGKLIYEGDIIKLKSNYDKQGNEREKYFINEIYFSNAKTRNCYCIKNGRFTKTLYGLSYNMEVIGNIHENKDLLNKER